MIQLELRIMALNAVLDTQFYLGIRDGYKYLCKEGGVVGLLLSTPENSDKDLELIAVGLTTEVVAKLVELNVFDTPDTTPLLFVYKGVVLISAAGIFKGAFPLSQITDMLV